MEVPRVSLLVRRFREEPPRPPQQRRHAAGAHDEHNTSASTGSPQRDLQPAPHRTVAGAPIAVEQPHTATPPRSAPVEDASVDDVLARAKAVIASSRRLFEAGVLTGASSAAFSASRPHDTAAIALPRAAAAAADSEMNTSTMSSVSAIAPRGVTAVRDSVSTGIVMDDAPDLHAPTVSASLGDAEWRSQLLRAATVAAARHAPPPAPTTSGWDAALRAAPPVAAVQLQQAPAMSVQDAMAAAMQAVAPLPPAAPSHPPAPSQQHPVSASNVVYPSITLQPSALSLSSTNMPPYADALYADVMSIQMESADVTIQRLRQRLAVIDKELHNPFAARFQNTPVPTFAYPAPAPATATNVSARSASVSVPSVASRSADALGNVVAAVTEITSPSTPVSMALDAASSAPPTAASALAAIDVALSQDISSLAALINGNAAGVGQLYHHSRPASSTETSTVLPQRAASSPSVHLAVPSIHAPVPRPPTSLPRSPARNRRRHRASLSSQDTMDFNLSDDDSDAPVSAADATTAPSATMLPSPAPSADVTFLSAMSDSPPPPVQDAHPSTAQEHNDSSAGAMIEGRVAEAVLTVPQQEAQLVESPERTVVSPLQVHAVSVLQPAEATPRQLAFPTRANTSQAPATPATSPPHAPSPTRVVDTAATVAASETVVTRASPSHTSPASARNAAAPTLVSGDIVPHHSSSGNRAVVVLLQSFEDVSSLLSTLGYDATHSAALVARPRAAVDGAVQVALPTVAAAAPVAAPADAVMMADAAASTDAVVVPSPAVPRASATESSASRHLVGVTQQEQQLLRMLDDDPLFLRLLQAAHSESGVR